MTAPTSRKLPVGRTTAGLADGPCDPKLGAHQCHIWLADLDLPMNVVSLLERMLSPNERARAAKFRDAGDKARYVVAHAALLNVLGRYLGIDAREVEFVFGECGKPALAPHHGLSFNMSHSHGLAAIGVARCPRIGVDIECATGNLGRAGMILPLLASDERRQLGRLGPNELDRGFLDCWVRKEAYLKALGHGLRKPLNAFSVDVSAKAAMPLRAALGGDDGGDWTIYPLNVGEAHVGAMAVDAGGALDLNYWHWSPKTYLSYP